MRYVFDGYILDTQRYELSCSGKAIKLRPKVFEVLDYLIRHRERVVSKDELLEHLWPQQFIADGTLNACLMAVRKAIGDSGQTQRRVQTLHGRGYRFVAAVEEQEHQRPGGTTTTAEYTTQVAAVAVPAQEQAVLIVTSEPPPPGHGIASAPPSPQEASVSAPLQILDQEHKQVTVLCGGLSEAAALATRLGAEAMHHYMQALLAHVQTTVEQYGGNMVQYGVDGFMALFGAPIAYEDHARRAVLAAHALQQALPEPQHAARLALSIGVHTGPVVVGSLAHEPHRLYTAMGDTIHLATSLQHAAAAGDILMGSATYQLVQEEVRGELWETDTLGTLALPAWVYRVREVVRRRAGVPERRAHPRGPFVGRAHELAILHERLAQAERGQGQVVGITGEAGIGKSRLLAEFWHSVQGRQLTCLTGQCLPYSQMSPYLPVLTLLRRRCQITDADAPETIRTKVYAAVQEARIGSEEDIALLLQLLDIPVETGSSAHDSPNLHQAHIFALLRQMIIYSRPQPMLLVVEDVHWIDASSEAWLATVVAGLAHQPLLLLVTYRPGYQPPWLGQSYATQLALPYLPTDESLRVVQAALPSAAVPDHVQQAIVTKAAGNPFFLEELTWSVLEHGDTNNPLGIPDTIQGVLAARIDRLPPAAKRLLQLAAVIGTEVMYPLLGALAGVPEDMLLQQLHRLQTAELLSEVSSHPAGVYAFTHALLQDVAYQSLLTRTRQADHQRVARIIEMHFPEQADSQPVLLAHHYTEAGLYPEAIEYWCRAGAHACQRGAHQEALAHLKRGLALLEGMPESDARQHLELELNITLGPIYMVTQGLTAPEVERVYRQAHALCDERTQISQRFAVLQGLHHVHRTRGHLHIAREFAEQLMSLAQATQDATLLLEGHMSLGMVLVSLGEFTAALNQLDQGLAYRDAGPYPLLPEISHPALGCLFYSGFALWYLGYPDQAQARIQEGLEMAQQLAYPHHVVWGQHLGAMFFQLCRDVQRMHELADAVVLGAARQGLQMCRLTGMVLQGWAFVQTGQEEAGIGQIQQGLTECRTQGIGASLPRYCALLAEAYRHVGRPIPGLALVAEAQAFIKQHGERTLVAELFRLRGELLLKQADRRRAVRDVRRIQVEAEECFQQALDLTRSQQAKMLELRAAVSLSRLWQRHDKRREAQQLLAEVYHWFAEGFETADLQEAKTLLAELEA
jgi:class 3 adenylate cyclase/DNA-binding winged helix-turn-helix (wHTH) protein/tetratricopeptide (TPR) repeat protein